MGTIHPLNGDNSSPKWGQLAKVHPLNGDNSSPKWGHIPPHVTDSKPFFKT